MSEYIETGKVESIVTMIVDQLGQPLTYRTNIKVKIWRISDSKYLDWADMTFRNAADVGSILRVMAEVNPVASPGEYRLDFNTSGIVNAVEDDTYEVTVIQDGANGAVNVPQVGEIRVGQWVDKAIAKSYTTMQSYSYDVRTGVLTGLVWIERDNLVLSNPTSAIVTWYSKNGIELFAVTTAEPDSQGFFRLEKETVLLTNASYYAVARVLIAGVGVVSSGKGIFTVG